MIVYALASTQSDSVKNIELYKKPKEERTEQNRKNERTHENERSLPIQFEPIKYE